MRNISILIAEDESIIALDLESLLKKAGYNNIFIVRDGDSLINKALSEVPSLIISDVNLKGDTNGMKAVNKIWEKQKIPTIFISGIKVDLTKFDQNYCGVVQKPYKGDEIINAINKLIK